MSRSDACGLKGSEAPRSERESVMKHEKSLYECFACGEMTAQEKENLSFIGKLRGEAVEYSAPGFRCGVCEFQWSTGEQQALHDHAKAEVYRSMHGMVTARQLEEARANYGMWSSPQNQDSRLGI